MGELGSGVSALRPWRERFRRDGRDGALPLSYAQQTHDSPHWIVRYAHEQRAVVAVEMILATRPRVVIDWGTGDGYVIERMLDHGEESLELVIAVEPDTAMVSLLRERLFAHRLGARVVVSETPDAVARALGGREVDVLACLGVLEHLPHDARSAFYAEAREHLAPTGSLVIDVPVEYGPALLVKEAARRLLKGRAPEYATRDLLKRSIGRTERDPARFDSDAPTDFIVFHTGFDHRFLIEEVQVEYRVVEQRNTPLGWAPAWAFNQEVIFRAVRRHPNPAQR